MPPQTQIFQISLLQNGLPLPVDHPEWPPSVGLHAPDMGACITHARMLMTLPCFAGADAARLTGPNGAQLTITREV